MAQEDPNRLTEWVGLVRAQVPVVRQRFEEWLTAVREEPALIWETAAVRYTAYSLGAVLLVLAASWTARGLAPPPPANAKPGATTADFHVICTSPKCGHHFVIHRELGFHRFPVECPACRGKTGMQGRRCYSPTCQGRWVAPQNRDDVLYCPICGSPL